MWLGDEALMGADLGPWVEGSQRNPSVSPLARVCPSAMPQDGSDLALPAPSGRTFKPTRQPFQDIGILPCTPHFP
jgi:hypothetical protein